MGAALDRRQQAGGRGEGGGAAEGGGGRLQPRDRAAVPGARGHARPRHRGAQHRQRQEEEGQEGKEVRSSSSAQRLILTFLVFFLPSVVLAKSHFMHSLEVYHPKNI